MELRERLDAELKGAMKARNARRVSTLRLVLAAVKERDIAVPAGEARAGISDGEILSLLAKLIKQREESAAAFATGGRPEMAAAEREEISIICEFMPRQMSAEETRAAIAAVIAELDANSLKDMGKVMGALKARHAGSMDFAKAGALVKELLSAPKRGRANPSSV